MYEKYMYKSRKNTQASINLKKTKFVIYLFIIKEVFVERKPRKVKCACPETERLAV